MSQVQAVFSFQVRLKDDKIKANRGEVNRLNFRIAELLDEVSVEKKQSLISLNEYTNISKNFSGGSDELLI